MILCNAENCKYCKATAVGQICEAEHVTLRVDNDTDDMTCKTFEYEKKEDAK